MRYSALLILALVAGSVFGADNCASNPCNTGYICQSTPTSYECYLVTTGIVECSFQGASINGYVVGAASTYTWALNGVVGGTGNQYTWYNQPKGTYVITITNKDRISTNITAVVSPPKSSTQWPTVVMTSTYVLVWTDSGATSTNHIACWKAQVPNTIPQYDKYYSLGHVCITSSTTDIYNIPPAFSVPMVQLEGSSAQLPTGFTEVWNSAGSGATSSTKFWRPICAESWLLPLGDVVSSTYPATSEVLCVRDIFQAEAGGFEQVFNLTNGNNAVGIFSVGGSSFFRVEQTPTTPANNYNIKLKEKVPCPFDCSGNGYCNYFTGVCACEGGFDGSGEVDKKLCGGCHCNPSCTMFKPLSAPLLRVEEHYNKIQVSWKPLYPPSDYATNAMISYDIKYRQVCNGVPPQEYFSSIYLWPYYDTKVEFSFVYGFDYQVYVTATNCKGTSSSPIVNITAPKSAAVKLTGVYEPPTIANWWKLVVDGKNFDSMDTMFYIADQYISANILSPTRADVYLNNPEIGTRTLVVKKGNCNGSEDSLVFSYMNPIIYSSTSVSEAGGDIYITGEGYGRLALDGGSQEISASINGFSCGACEVIETDTKLLCNDCPSIATTTTNYTKGQISFYDLIVKVSGISTPPLRISYESTCALPCEHGFCNSDSICECEDGWSGDSCSQEQSCEDIINHQTYTGCKECNYNVCCHIESAI